MSGTFLLNEINKLENYHYGQLSCRTVLGQGKQRAEYGAALIEELSKRLAVEYGHGFNKTNLWYMRQFYLSFQNLHALRGELRWNFKLNKDKQ